ncbi:MAG TPA: class D sortase [Gemmatimonadaceae bacterium]|nr:class D sortase [Gemmatimonadaceae bacterium]
MRRDAGLSTERTSPRHTDPLARRALRVLGTITTAAGALLLGYAGWTYASGRLANERARATWNAREAHRAVMAVRASVGPENTPVALAPGSVVGRLWIPSIALDEIVVEGVDAPQLNVAPGHLPGSVLPGLPGNAVVSAHRDRHFHHLDRVAVGDTVITEIPGRRTLWVVAERRVVKAGEPAIPYTATPTLTLTTCWPVRYLGPAPDRLILVAYPVSDSPRA